MLAVSLSCPILAGTLAATLALTAPVTARAGQVPSDDALACLLPVFDSQTPPADTKGDKIDPKAAEAAAKAKAKWWRSDELRAEFAITDAQSAELDRIFHTFYASLKSGMEDVDRYHKDVSKMMAEDRAARSTCCTRSTSSKPPRPAWPARGC